ncbi:hypothetical protein GCM10010954_17440 [Halobacillus andaensis]|uniref:DUF3006 domain-containing protein n=1 Tax=Halobacillus andaensis TaxID=1176239 RepID=A0A917B2J0_HALAA|nr:DUF3006 domain-containing protein [Halobacillus andaensis]MBP2004753.1 hypothetical protein [Halobacillus andaensis]GGF19202.1 hypothetical protein GCM10010954_17440 [Halobacillus andaensis]
MKAVFDRLEEGKYAVLLVEDHHKEFVLNKDDLPKGSKPNDWFEVTIEGDQVTSIKQDPEAAAAQEKKVKDKRNQLKKRSKGSRFKRK